MSDEPSKCQLKDCWVCAVTLALKTLREDGRPDVAERLETAIEEDSKVVDVTWHISQLTNERDRLKKLYGYSMLAVEELAIERDELWEVVEDNPTTIDGVHCSMMRRLFHHSLGWVTLESIEKNLDGDMEWNYLSEDKRTTTPEWCYSSKEAYEADLDATKNGGEG